MLCYAVPCYVCHLSLNDVQLSLLGVLSANCLSLGWLTQAATAPAFCVFVDGVEGVEDKACRGAAEQGPCNPLQLLASAIAQTMKSQARADTASR